MSSARSISQELGATQRPFSNTHDSRLEKIKLVAFSIFKEWICLCTGKLKAFRWGLTHRVEKMPSYFTREKTSCHFNMDSLDEFLPEEMKENFREAITSYADANEIEFEEALERLNSFLKKGVCFGECALLFLLAKEFPEEPMERILERLNDGYNVHQLGYYQTLIELRIFFQEENSAIQECFPFEKPEPLGSNNLREQLRANITSSDQVLFVYNESEGHVLFLRINPEKELFCFYDPAIEGGYYSFESEKKLLKAFTTFYRANYSTKKETWIESYSLKEVESTESDSD